jgi:hypothetical protein
VYGLLLPLALLLQDEGGAVAHQGVLCGGWLPGVCPASGPVLLPCQGVPGHGVWHRVLPQHQEEAGGARGRLTTLGDMQFLDKYIIRNQSWKKLHAVRGDVYFKIEDILVQF